MLVSIALTETRDEIYWAETETYCSETETMPETHRSETETRPRRWGFCPRRDRDGTLVRFETVSRPIRLDRDHIPVKWSPLNTTCPVNESHNGHRTFKHVHGLRLEKA